MNHSTNEVISAAKEKSELYAPRQLDILKQLSAIDCGSGDLEGNAAVVKILDKILSEIPGIQIQHKKTGKFGETIIAKLNAESPNGKIIINAHTDTVYRIGDAAAHPFRTERDKAYGLGCADCKGGVIVSIFAVKAMQEADMLPDKEIVMIYGCDEEAGSPASTAIYKEEAAGAEKTFVFEPSRTENGILTSRKGVLDFKIEISGKKAHSGTSYLDGRSAVIELAQKIVYLYEHNDNTRKIQFNVVAPKDGGDASNIVPSYAEATVSVRIRNQEDDIYVKKVCAELEKHAYIDGCITKVTLLRKSLPMERTEKNIRLYQLIADVGKKLGMELPEQSSGGSGDAATFTQMGIPTVDGLGPYMYCIHSFEESFRISSIAEKTKLFSAILGFL